MIRALRCLGDKLAWLDNPNAERLLPLEEVYRRERSRDEDPVKQYADYPLTGIHLYDTVAALANISIQIESSTYKFMGDCATGRFRSGSDYATEDLSTACAGLLLDTLAILKLSCELKTVLQPGSESDAEAEITAYLNGRLRIQESDVFLLYRYINARRNNKIEKCPGKRASSSSDS